MLAALQRSLSYKCKRRRRALWAECVVLALCFALAQARCGSGVGCYRGECRNETCVCHEGWQGPECQHCGGKIKLTELSGFIHDGPGNYSVGVKCSWLLEPAVAGPAPPIRVRLESFATECGWDHLYVYGGDSVRAPPLGVYSGVISEEDTSSWTRQVVARSGRALIHFFSDDAYSMAGFNVSYAAYACPSDQSHTNCSNHGACEDGICTCDPGWLGSACDRPLCPNECNASAGWGRCGREGCTCSAGRAGEDCAQAAADAGWEWLWREPGEERTQTEPPPPPVAGHSLVTWHSRPALLRVGGETYGRGAFIYQYHLQERRWESVVGPAEGGTWAAGEAPAPRLAHTAVVHADSLLVYGGRVSSGEEHGGGLAGLEGRGGDVTNELWLLDLTARVWTNLTPVDCHRHQPAPMGHCGGLHVAGHSAVIVELGRSPVMLSFFGHSPHYGYLNIVQEYWLEGGYWTAPATRGWPARGGFAHSSAWDSLSQLVYVHGGLLSESEANRLPSGALYSYEPQGRLWRLLAAAPQPRYLHTATFITPGIMLVFGGNVHNDTSGDALRCWAGHALLYDTRCDTWHAAPSPPAAARAAHAAASLHRPGLAPAVLVLGGFDGRLRSDALALRSGWEAGGCGARRTPVSCLRSARAAADKCVWREDEQICLHISELLAESHWNRSRVIMCSESDTSARGAEARCLSSWACGACVAAGCVWCGACHASAAPCHRHRQVAKELEECGEMTEEAAATCGRLHSCAACHQHGLTHHSNGGVASRGCHWDYEHARCLAGDGGEEARGAGAGPGGCPAACATLHSCANCTAEECIWCASAARCVDKNAYSASFPLGGCRAWSAAPAGGAACARSGACRELASCAQCRAEPACGWCDDGAGGGRGACVPGGARGPHAPHICRAEQWHFTRCPACQCNGHAVCAPSDEGPRCVQPCGGRAIGDHCETCAPGHWGSPLNGGACQACECNAQALACAADTGRCFCSTKGLAGDRCDKCDATNHYHADPLNKGACYYDLAVDYQFTFNLSKKEDRHLTAINFRNSPVKADVDADFSITCSAHARMNLTVRTHAHPAQRTLFHDVNCSSFRYRFAKSEHAFGTEDNVTLTTFFVYVYDFRPPLWIQISFSQYPKLNLQQFFITFSSCFLLLLLVAAALWKIKQKYDLYRRRQRLFVEMEQMASRPFSQVAVELERGAAAAGAAGVPSPVALEPCRGSRAAVLSLLVRLPTGGSGRAPPLGGLAVASALVTLGHAPHAPSRKHSHPHAAAAAAL